MRIAWSVSTCSRPARRHSRRDAALSVHLHALSRAGRSFERFEGIWVADRAVTGDGEPESISGRPRLRRLLRGARRRDRAPAACSPSRKSIDDVKVAVLSDGFWQRRFGGDPRRDWPRAGRRWRTAHDHRRDPRRLRSGLHAHRVLDTAEPARGRAARERRSYRRGRPAARRHRGAGGERDGGTVPARSRTSGRRSSNGTGATACSTCGKRATARKATPC